MEQVFSCVSVKQLKLSRPFFKVIARNLQNRETEKLKKLKELFEKEEEASEVTVGEIYIVKLSPSQYERCRVVTVSPDNKHSSIILIDCACTGSVKANQVSRLY